MRADDTFLGVRVSLHRFVNRGLNRRRILDLQRHQPALAGGGDRKPIIREEDRPFAPDAAPTLGAKSTRGPFDRSSGCP